MNKPLKKKLPALIGLICVIAVIAIIARLSGGSQSFQYKYEGEDLSTDVSGLGRSDTYTNYLAAHSGAPGVESASKAEGGTASSKSPISPVSIDIARFTGDGEARGEGGADCVYCGDGSTVTWEVEVPTAGLYNIAIEYLTTQSRGVDIERELRINGEIPFASAGQLIFTRLWEDGGEVRKDNQGNDIRPTQVERFDWQRALCSDPMGYEAAPYQFYFEAGVNTITLYATNEPFIVRAIELTPAYEVRDYAQYLSEMPGAESPQQARTYQAIVQGESAALRSSPSLYARYDRSSADTVPYSVYNTVLNYIGGDPWNYAGQWIEWDFEVPDDGWYTITLKARQAYQRGALSCRSIYIDGEIPFSELSSVAFGYSTAWSMRTLGDESGAPYRLQEQPDRRRELYALQAVRRACRAERLLRRRGHDRRVC